MVFTDPELTAQEKFRHFPTLMNAINFSTPRPRHPKWPEIENAFGIELSKAVAGTITPEEALKNSQPKAEPKPEPETGLSARGPLGLVDVGVEILPGVAFAAEPGPADPRCSEATPPSASSGPSCAGGQLC